MSKYTKEYTDLQMPLTELSLNKLLGKIEQQTSHQTVAATLAGDVAWVATFEGALFEAYVVIEAAAAAGESMTYDIQKNGVSMLTGVLTVDSTVADTDQISLASLIDTSVNFFAPGDVITVDRVYTAGGGPTPIANNDLVIEPSLGPITPFT